MRRAGPVVVWALMLATLAVATGGSAAPHSAVPMIETIAGNGADGSDGDGGPATAATINHPRGIAVLRDGSIVFAQPFVPMVRRITLDGRITRSVGDGTHGYSGDGGPALAARVALVHGVAAMPDGGFVIADMSNSRIRRVLPDGTITTVAGSGVQGYGGDGGQASAAAIAVPRGVASRSNGELLIPDTGNARVRRVATDGTITTVAGSGVKGYGGDGGPAAAAQLNRPFSVAPLADGGFLIADLDNNRIRRVDARGIITTVAGTGEAGFGGDGGPATSAALNQPHAVVGLPDGGFLIADTYNHRVRRVWPDRRITTIAGTGEAAFSADGPAAGSALNQPKALALLPDLSGFLVGDAANNRIRLVRTNLRPALRLRVTTPRLTTSAGRSATLRYTLSARATLRLEVLRSGAVVSTVGRVGVTGANTLAFGRRLEAGTYRVRLTATTRDGRSDRGAASLRVRR